MTAGQSAAGRDVESINEEAVRFGVALNDCECGAPSSTVVVTFNGSWLIECCDRCARKLCDPIGANA